MDVKFINVFLQYQYCGMKQFNFCYSQTVRLTANWSRYPQMTVTVKLIFVPLNGQRQTVLSSWDTPLTLSQVVYERSFATWLSTIWSVIIHFFFFLCVYIL